MTTFDQRGQKVTYQYNAAGDINFGSVSTSAETIGELKKLLDEVLKAVESGIIDKESGIDVEAKMKKAIVQAEKPNPDKKSILNNIDGAKRIIESMASAVGLVSGFIQAAETVRKFL
jgi:hypothetical protein